VAYSSLYEQYLDISDDIEDGFSKVTCPFKENHKNGDKNRSAGVHLQKGIFNCYVCGSMSPAAFVAKMDSTLTFAQASAIVDELKRGEKLIEKSGGFTNVAVHNPAFDRLFKKSRENFSEDLDIVKEYCSSRSLSFETLNELEVGFLPAKDINKFAFGKEGRQRDCLVFAYRLNGKVVGLRYRDAEGNKGGEPGCHFIPWGVDDLYPGCKFVIVEGESDRLRTYQELKAEGLPYVVVSTPTASFRKEWKREFDECVAGILIPQDDEASEKLCDKVKKILGTKLTVQKLKWRKRQTGKDICEWLIYNPASELASICRQLDTNVKQVLNGQQLKVQVARRLELGSDRIIHDLVRQGQIAYVVGPPKTHKTFLCLEVARCFLNPEEELMGIQGLRQEEGVGKVRNVLLIEEEGSDIELEERLEKTLAGTGWLSSFHIMHRQGVKLDQEHWVEYIEEQLKEKQIDLLILDPLRDLHDRDEDSSTDMIPVIEALRSFVRRLPHLVVWVVHHFNKAGLIQDKWKSLRGASSISGSADLGIFVDNLPASQGLGIQFCFDGRSIPQLKAGDDSGIFKAVWSEEFLRLTVTQDVAKVSKHEALKVEMQLRKQWKYKDAVTFFGCTRASLDRWIDKLHETVEKIELEGEKGVMLRWTGPAE